MGWAFLRLDGDDDYVSFANRSDFTLGADEWVIDCWFRAGSR